MTLLDAALARRRATRFSQFRHRIPAPLVPAPFRYDVTLNTGNENTILQISDLPGAARRQQLASRFRFLERQRAGKLSQPTADT